MKVQATVLLSFQAKTFEDAGAILDELLGRARERDDVEVGRVDVASPPGDRMVTLPPSSASVGAPRHVPPSVRSGNGA